VTTPQLHTPPPPTVSNPVVGLLNYLLGGGR